MVTNSKKRNKTRSLCRCWAAVTLLVLAGFVADIFVGVPSSEGQKQQEQEEKEEVASASRHQRPAGEAGAAAAPAVTNRSTCIELNAWLPRRTEPAVVLQLVSAHYVDLERNFVRLMERNSGFTRENLYLMCLDREAFEALRGFGIRCVPVNDMRDYALHDLWRLRLRVLRCLLAKGHDVIMSDSDALWLHDPVRAMQDIEGVNSSSIVASKGGYPFALAEAWGSTICMGFVLFRAAPDEGMRVFQREVELVVSESGDDQAAVNAAAQALGIVWDESSDMRYKKSTGFGRGVIPGLGGSGGGGTGEFTVTLLPHSEYTRKCKSTAVTNATVVAHCSSRKRSQSKSKWMKKGRFWEVDE